MVERLDLAIGRLLEALDRGAHSPHTLVIFTNDNGGERLSNNGPAFHQKMTLWEGGVRVPAIMRWPGHIRPHTTTAQVSRLHHGSWPVGGPLCLLVPTCAYQPRTIVSGSGDEQ